MFRTDPNGSFLKSPSLHLRTLRDRFCSDRALTACPRIILSLWNQISPYSQILKVFKCFETRLFWATEFCHSQSLDERKQVGFPLLHLSLRRPFMPCFSILPPVLSFVYWFPLPNAFYRPLMVNRTLCPDLQLSAATENWPWPGSLSPLQASPVEAAHASHPKQYTAKVGGGGWPLSPYCCFLASLLLSSQCSSFLEAHVTCLNHWSEHSPKPLWPNHDFLPSKVLPWSWECSRINTWSNFCWASCPWGWQW